MVKVGIAGIGFMGVTHYRAWGEVAGAEVCALYTRSEQKLSGDWREIQGNFGGSGGVQDLSHLARYQRYEDLLADDSLDLIDLCLPTKVHPETAIAALEAGKHVLVEKPIALNLADADRMIAAAKANGRMLMVAQVLRFWPEWLWLKQAVVDGRYGRLQALNLQRVIAVPDWSAEMTDLASNGGPLIDLHIHDTDYVLYLLGKPATVHATGTVKDDVVTYVASSYGYPDGAIVSCQSGAVSSKGRPFRHAFEAWFETAVVTHAAATEPANVEAQLHQSSCQTLTVYLADGTADYPDVPARDAFEAELAHAANCVGGGGEACRLSAESAREALAVVLLEAESVRTGRVIEIA